ncbi:nima-interacting protein [Grosmannia clavigera kw1407]|uniref:Nima-interacting protein n=1 Tax=Grosmannia clavigera (strain kw1407 / UAMH 11150) TaxID=655863 RepID=F0XU25_GROCL|nr:nima-interacting protein [Grosmannia clavigera kw1407]EFW98501.1 nima-interacting protein [Grosmannia clavigera kw1407]
MPSLNPPPLLIGAFVFLLLIGHVHAFGAGNIAGISKVEGQNWRHGDIEDTLLKLLMARAVGGKKFDKLAVSRVYFGNWLRDYSQAIDVGTVKAVSSEAIRLLLCVLGFLTFGFGSKEFEVTADRLGCYRPEDHIDNPKNYADNVDARRYDRRLRGPVNERVELAIDPETGMKNYIANERANIMTSAYHVRKLFGRCIELGRSYRRSKNKADFYEALRLLGTGLHCLEDFLAHSNYTELALIEMGETEVFPHVGRDTTIRLRGARHQVYPCITGTFGGVDFLHSVTGEVSDKLTQNEIQELEGTLQNGQNSDTSALRNLLDMFPSGLFGGGSKTQKLDNIQNNANAAQMEQMTVSPLEPEEFTRHIQFVFKQIMPAIEFHDEIIKSITEAVEQIPVLPKLIEQLEEQLSVFVFSIIAPFVIPIIHQVQNELSTGSSEIIQSSQAEQLIVFNDDYCTDPTHSMLSKDHFSNILNEIAGRTASKVVAWVVPQLMDAWDNDSIDVNRTLNRIVNGVLHHPAQRAMGEDGAQDGRALMFQSVEEWWQSMPDDERQDYRNKLSRRGVERGENHKEGVHDTGHGCGHPLSMQKTYGGNSDDSPEDRIASAAASAIVGGLTSGVSSFVQQQTGLQLSEQSGGNQSSLAGLAGASGLGGLLGAASSFLGSGFQQASAPSVSSRRDDDGSYSQTYTQYGRTEDGKRYAQAEYTRTDYPDGEERTDYRRYEQDEEGRGGRVVGYGFEERAETHTTHSNTYEEREERGWADGRGGYREEREERFGEDRRRDVSSGDEGWRQRHEHGEEDEGRGGRRSSGRRSREDRGWEDQREEEEPSRRGGRSNVYGEEYSIPPQRSDEEARAGFFDGIVREARTIFDDDEVKHERHHEGWGC